MENWKIIESLESAIPIRFQDYTPRDFENFIAEMFNKYGYKVMQTSYVADYGADIIIEKDGVKTAVQVKRYKELNKVCVSDINQVIGAKAYYQTDKTMVITTSSYTKSAKILAKQALVELWDWTLLYKNICEIFFDGRDYYDYFDFNNSDDLIALRYFTYKVVKVISYSNYKGNSEPFTFVKIQITNNTKRNLDVCFDLPVCVTSNNMQYKAVTFLTGSFLQGVIFAKSSVVFGFWVNKDFKCRASDKIILNYNLDDTNNTDVHIVPENSTLNFIELMNNKNSFTIITLILIGFITFACLIHNI